MLLSPNTLLGPSSLLGSTFEAFPQVAMFTITRFPTNPLNRYDVGDAISFRGRLTDEDGEPITGAPVTARVMHGNTTTPRTVVENADGYTVTLTLTSPGLWRLRMECSQPRVAEEDLVLARITHFP